LILFIYSSIHLVNRASGIPNQPDNGAIDEIPRVGPVIITVKTAKPPVSVTAAWEGGKPRWKHKGQTLTITLDAVHIHEAIAIRRAQKNIEPAATGGVVSSFAIHVLSHDALSQSFGDGFGL
jgi:hypothetical protein